MSEVDYAARHKKAFRVAFDILNRNWPPVKTVDFFNKLYAECIEASRTELADNPLGQGLLKEIYWYLADMAEGGATDG